MFYEYKIYSSKINFLINTILFPLKMLIPQPIIKKIPGLLTNHEIRIKLVCKEIIGKVLDIGCGENQLVNIYKNSGGQGIGVDVFDWGNVDLLVENTSKLPFKKHSFDTVTFVASLNHIPNRTEVLREALRVIKPKGIVILTNLTPFISFIWHKWAFWDKDQHERGMKEGELWGFKHYELIQLISKSGFRLVKHKSFSYGLNNLYIIKPSGN